jgi:hypothetical protein
LQAQDKKSKILHYSSDPRTFADSFHYFCVSEQFASVKVKFQIKRHKNGLAYNKQDRF